MQKNFLLVIALFIISKYTVAQPAAYLVYSERANEKTYKGIINKNVLLSDTSFHWYVESLDKYTPYAAAVENLRNAKDSVELVAFMGTWCDDSHFVIPKLFTLIDASGFCSDKLTLFGVDRKKKSTAHIAEAFHILNVPTIIVFKKGVEIGRVVEYGKTGLFDKDLAEILLK